MKEENQPIMKKQQKAVAAAAAAAPGGTMTESKEIPTAAVTAVAATAATAATAVPANTTSQQHVVEVVPVKNDLEYVPFTKLEPFPNPTAAASQLQTPLLQPSHLKPPFQFSPSGAEKKIKQRKVKTHKSININSSSSSSSNNKTNNAAAAIVVQIKDDRKLFTIPLNNENEGINNNINNDNNNVTTTNNNNNNHGGGASTKNNASTKKPRAKKQQQQQHRISMSGKIIKRKKSNNGYIPTREFNSKLKTLFKSLNSFVSLSDDAIPQLKCSVENELHSLTGQWYTLARHAKRQTVKMADLNLFYAISRLQIPPQPEESSIKWFGTKSLGEYFKSKAMRASASTFPAINDHITYIFSTYINQCLKDIVVPSS